MRTAEPKLEHGNIDLGTRSQRELIVMEIEAIRALIIERKCGLIPTCVGISPHRVGVI